LAWALPGVFLLVMPGCVRAERDAGESRIDGSGRSSGAAAPRIHETASPVRKEAEASQRLQEERKIEPPTKEGTSTVREPSRAAGAPAPAPDSRPAGAKKTVEEKIKEAIAEIKGGQTAAAEKELMQEITGLIVEETMTKIGYEFYETFFLLWEAPQVQVKDYNILITEKATPTWGSLVEVKIGETAVFGRMLRPRSEDIEEAVKEAIGATRQYLDSYDKEQLQSPDLTGSGI